MKVVDSLQDHLKIGTRLVNFRNLERIYTLTLLGYSLALQDLSVVILWQDLFIFSVMLL